MAITDINRPTAGASAGGLFSFFSNAVATISAWNDARITRKSLSKLTARELDDIGLTVGDIEKIAGRVTR